MHSSFETEAHASSAFLSFLRRAAEAHANGAAQTETSCLEATAKLHPLDDDSLDLLVTTLFQQQRHDEAVELAAIIAQLDLHRAVAQFRHGHALQMANWHEAAIAPYRRALAIKPRLPATFTTFDNTAASIGALDLVITVCTSVAHLSGAPGRRTWMRLDVNPHWVWLLDRNDSPWSATVRPVGANAGRGRPRSERTGGNSPLSLSI